MAKLGLVKRNPADPHSALRRPARTLPLQRSAPRHLTEQQLKNPLIRAAHQRLSSIVSHRGKYLRRLDTVHGDRRTRLEKFVALEKLAEQLLIRLDLATGVLGYIDDRGRFILNTQCNLASDAGISAPVLSRLLATLDEAGYVYRRIERVRLDEKDEHGLHLVRTRVLIRLTQQFWADLGLRYVHARVQNAARKKREAQLREIGQRKMAELERHSVEQMRRERSRERWKAKEARLSGGAQVASNASTSPQSESPKPVSQNALAALEKLHASLTRKSQSS